jgi:putative endonuclease
VIFNNLERRAIKPKIAEIFSLVKLQYVLFWYTLAMENPWYVYILKCADGTLYTGITTDLVRRLAEHNDTDNKKAAKYTRARRPVSLVYSKKLPDRSNSLIEEARIKKLSKTEKEKLVKLHIQK